MKTCVSVFLVMVVSAVCSLAAEKPSAEVWAASARNILGSVEIRANGERIGDVTGAFRATLQELGYFETEAKIKTREVVLGYRTRQDEKIVVKLKEFSDHTHIKVRVGLPGNDALARQILERVYERL